MTASETLPIQVHILWGSTLDPDDTPSSYAFATAQEEEAFWSGVGEADGWMEMEEVSGADWRVDAEGEIVPRKVKTPTPIKPHARYVIWGEHPDPGTRPSVYSFDSEGKAAAFSLGASEMVGWTCYNRVPGPAYRYMEQDNPACHAHLSPLGKLALEALNSGILPSVEPVFMDAAGAYVSADWSPDQGIVDFVPAFDRILREKYGVGLVDVGMDATLLAKLMRDHEDAPAEAAQWYGNKYDLDPVSETLPAPRPRF